MYAHIKGENLRKSAPDINNQDDLKVEYFINPNKE